VKEFAPTAPTSIPAEPFFLKTDYGERFCLFYPPRSDDERSGAFIYIHPFGDEMNKSRRMAAMQARAFAAMGFSVLQIDLFGCGDSSGEFRDARWDIWKHDLAVAKRWIENRASSPASLWGLRLGALLALDFAKSSGDSFDQIILWQPVINGELFLNQFLRLQMAKEIFTDASMEKTSGKNKLRNRLANGETLEIAGYELTSSLAAAIDNLKAAELIVTKGAIHWFEIVAEAGRSMVPAGTNVITEWRRKGIDPKVHLVPCVPFWATQEISECPELVSATLSVFAAAAT
jgi:exosortase A-associated hydrolase 2